MQAFSGQDIDYTCPMHPQVRQRGPGHCPTAPLPHWGTALEPVLATAGSGEESPELRDMTRRFRIGTALTLPVFALEMGGHLANLAPLPGQQLSNWIQFLLGTPVVLWRRPPAPSGRCWTSRPRQPSG
jgi:Cu+-exporting ATPase